MNKLDRLASRFRLKPLRLLLLPWLIWLPGCATQDYALYTAGQAKVEQARYEADSARYKALAAIAQSGDTTAKVAAVMAMQTNGGAQESTKLQAPQPNQALQWAQIIVPGLTQTLGMRYQYLTNTAQSANALKIAESQNATYLGISSKIQAPAANYTLSGTGSIGGVYSTDRHDSTLSGSGTIGSSSPYTDSKPITTTDNHQVSTTDSHPITTTTTTTTPAPVVVTPVVQIVPVVNNTTAATATATSSVFTPFWVTQ